MAAQSKACFTVVSYQENMDFFNTSFEKEFDFWNSQKAAGIAVGMHHREVDDKNHDHWMIGWSKSAPSTSDFVKLLKERNAELIADAKSHGKDVTITLDNGSTVERQFYKIYTGRYANKHCVFNPEALNDYLSHSTKNAQAENKVQYDPDKDVIYSDGFDLDSYLSRDAVQKAKKEEQQDDALLMADIYDMIRDTGITNIIDLSQYVRHIGRMDLLNYMHAHSATVHFAINDEYRDNHNGKVPYTVEQECKEKYPDGTNSEDEKPYRPEPEPVKKTYSESQAILRRSTDELFGAPSVEAAPSEDTAPESEESLSGIPAESGSAKLPESECEASLSGIPTEGGSAKLPDSEESGSSGSALADPSAHFLTEDDFEEIDISPFD